MNTTVKVINDAIWLAFTHNGVEYGIPAEKIPTPNDTAREVCVQYVYLKFGDREDFIAAHDERQDWSGFVDSAGDLKRADLVSAVRGFYH